MALVPIPEGAPQRFTVWKHTKGGLYRVLFVGRFQTREFAEDLDHEPVVVYEGLDRQVAEPWVRPLEEFLDRFAPYDGPLPPNAGPHLSPLGGPLLS